MEIGIRVVTSDCEFGFDLLETTRFPERRPVIVPGEAIICSESVLADDDSQPEGAEIIDLVVDINENTSIDMFANWFYQKLMTRTETIYSLIINGRETLIDEADIMRSIEESQP